jgi:signal transduction histidine kinase
MASAIAEELKGDYPSVTFEVQPDLRVHGDPHLLRMVLYNLMENACKYSSREREPHVWVGEENGEGFVRDNGIGFDMQFLPKLFQPFERLHRDEGIPGTGIGLANVKRIVERHGGKVRAEGRVGEGATFYFRLA